MSDYTKADIVLDTEAVAHEQAERIRKTREYLEAAVSTANDWLRLYFPGEPQRTVALANKETASLALRILNGKD